MSEPGWHRGPLRRRTAPLVGGALLAVVVLGGSAALLVTFGGGSDGGADGDSTNLPPDLSDLVVGDDADEQTFCDVAAELTPLSPAASPTTWADTISRMAPHAYDDESEAAVRALVATYSFVVDGGRDIGAVADLTLTRDEAPTTVCGNPFTTLVGPEAPAHQRLRGLAEDLALEQDLQQPDTHFALAYGTAIVLFRDPTFEQVMAACEAWGDEPFEILADDGLVWFGHGVDEVGVLEDPIVLRSGADGSCRREGGLGL